MITPPVSGEPITSPWGIAVSDLLNGRPRCIINGVGFSAPNGSSSLTNIIMTTAAVIEDTHGFYDDAVDGPRIPVGMAGLYFVSWWIEFNSNSTGNRRYCLRKNGSNYQHLYDGTATGSGTAGNGHASIMRLAEADYLNLAEGQSSGAALTVNRHDIHIMRIGE